MPADASSRADDGTEDGNDVLIIGGGFAGLVLAQGLQHRGVPCRVFERDGEAGAGSKGYRFRVVDAGVAALERALPPALWRLLERTRPESSPPDLLLLDAATGARTALVPARDRHSYPVDRPWAHELLRVGLGEGVLHFGKSLESYELLPPPPPEGGGNGGGGGGRVRARFADGTAAVGRVLVAADGVHSRVRRQFLPAMRLLDVERTSIWGRAPLDADFHARFARDDVLAHHFAVALDPADPRRSCLFAPIRWPAVGDAGNTEDTGSAAAVKGRLSAAHPALSDRADYMFWVLNSETPSSPLAAPADRRAYAQRITASWDPSFRALVDMSRPEDTAAIPIRSSRPDVPAWPTDDRLTFVGDAIHPMSPSGGSGGLAAAQDAADLCDVLSGVWKSGGRNGFDGGDDGAELREALATYESSMRERAKGYIEHSFAGGKMIWAGKDWTEYSEFRDY